MTTELSAKLFCWLFSLMVISSCDRPNASSTQTADASNIDPDISIVVEPSVLGLPNMSAAKVATVGRIPASNQRPGGHCLKMTMLVAAYLSASFDM